MNENAPTNLSIDQGSANHTPALSILHKNVNFAGVAMSSSPCASCERLKESLQNPSPSVLLAHGLTAARLAALLHVSRSTVHRWYQAGRIPESARYDVARELLDIICRGGRHDQ